MQIGILEIQGNTNSSAFAWRETISDCLLNPGDGKAAETILPLYVSEVVLWSFNFVYLTSLHLSLLE